jgi:hypothetical protein
MTTEKRTTFSPTPVTIAALALVATGCGLKASEKKEHDGGQCKVAASTAVPEGDGGGADANDDVDAAEPVSETAKTLPIDATSSQLWLEVAYQPDPKPTAQPTNPTDPFPVDECRLPGTYYPDPIGIDPDSPNVDPVATTCDEGAKPVASPKLKLGATEDYDKVSSPTSLVCPSDGGVTKNVPATGHDETLKLDWQVVTGQLVYEEAKVACGDLGADWHLAEEAELDSLLKLPAFKAPVETGCTTSFWAKGARDQGSLCVAPYRGIQYQSSGTGGPLPINNTLSVQPLTGYGSVLERRSAMCVKGTLKPLVACSTAVAKFFVDRPLGALDAKTGLTWAKITVKTFTSASEVEAQCAFGASQGWRMPTKAELEAAVKNDLFKTGAYQEADASCPLAWHKPDDAVSKVTCGKLSTVGGAVPFFTDVACTNGYQYDVQSTSGVGIDSTVAAPPGYGSTGAVLGLCVQDKH